MRTYGKERDQIPFPLEWGFRSPLYKKSPPLKMIPIITTIKASRIQWHSNRLKVGHGLGKPQLVILKQLRKVFTGSSHLGGSARKSKQVYKKHRLPTSVALFCTVSRGKRQNKHFLRNQIPDTKYSINDIFPWNCLLLTIELYLKRNPRTEHMMVTSERQSTSSENLWENITKLRDQRKYLIESQWECPHLFNKHWKHL